MQVFPDECKSSRDEILSKLYSNLQDNIPSVREGAATALKRFASAYFDSSKNVFTDIRKGLNAVSEQPDNSTINENLESGKIIISDHKSHSRG